MSEKFPCIEREPLKLPKPPARASEAFLSTIAQGMWAEEKLIEAINSIPQFVAVRYGQSRYDHELISSKSAWKNYVTKLYEQMSKYGKRPDILVFRRDDTSLSLPKDISEKDEECIKDIVYKSIAGIECRSSSYYYDEYIRERGRDLKELSITVKDEDIDRLIKWRETYCGSKPVYYVQLFFDKGFFISFDEVLNIINDISRRGGTPIILGINESLVGVFEVSDEIRSEIPGVIEFFKHLGFNIGVASGDMKASVEFIKEKLKLDFAYASLKPIDKAKIIKEMQFNGVLPVYVGDGINDAIAINVAFLGIAMGKAPDLARESGDVILLSNNLNALRELYCISKKVVKIAKENLFWAFIYNSVLIPVAAGVFYPFIGLMLRPEMAALAMILSDISVVLNSFRLLLSKTCGYSMQNASSITKL